MDEARCQHYTLAHVALRQIGLHDPLLYLGVLGSERAEEFLTSVLESVNESCAGQPTAATFTAKALKIHRLRIGDHPTAIIEFPEPLKAVEAYYTALVLLTPPGPIPPPRDQLQARYFTLERAVSFDSVSRTMLCEWSDEWTHSNLGEGPEPTIPGFAAAIERQLARS